MTDNTTLREDFNKDKRASELPPLADLIRAARERLLDGLIEIGYITEDERAKYLAPLEALPTTPKDWAVAYYLVSMEGDREELPLSKLSDLISKISRDQRKRYTDEQRAELRRQLATMSDEEKERLAAPNWNETYKAAIRQRIERAETFVASKRKRLRNYLYKFIIYEICGCLLYRQESEELDEIPSITAYLEFYGYNEDNKSLSDTDKEALRQVGAACLNSLELALLTGTAFIRNEEYERLKDENGAFKETFYYRDVFDELLTSLDNSYSFLWRTFYNSYVGGTATDAAEYAKNVVSELRARKYATGEVCTPQESKFNEFLKEEGVIC